MDYYSGISKGYNELHEDEQLEKIDRIIEMFGNKLRVLDIGCGTAFYADKFKEYIGVDNSMGMLKQARCNVVFGDAESLPFKDNSFDLVISVTAIHNFKDYKKALKEIKRVGKGKIAISLLKKAIRYDEIQKEIQDNFNVKEIDMEKDVLFYVD